MSAEIDPVSAEIDQVYCTHCTYGSSAIERRQGDMADRVLGYGARASSWDAAELRKNYRDFERLVYYTLPVDAPSEEKMRLDASSAPKRFVYCPTFGRVKLLGQLSYRKTDTTGRPGSYFGHVLVGDAKGPAWSVLECLQTWGGSWADEDQPSFQFELSKVAAIRDLATSGRPAIDDGVLISFLTTPAHGNFDDPHQVITDRWRGTSVEERFELIAETLRGYLQLGANRRDSVVLVIEPSMAALVFYGVASLLPPGKIRDEISFSTFESNVDRLLVVLAATWFHKPETDLRPEAYRRAGYVHHTVLNKKSTAQRPAGAYVPLVTGLLQTRGLAAVKELLADFAAAKPENSDNLESLAQAHAKATAAFEPGSPALTWRDGVEAEYLAAALRRSFIADASRLDALAGTPNYLPILELLCTVSDLNKEERKSLKVATRRLKTLEPDASLMMSEYLKLATRRLTPEQLAAFADCELVHDSWKITALRPYLRSTNQFPPDCKSIWQPSPGARNKPPAPWILPGLLDTLSGRRLQQVFTNVPAANQGTFLQALLQVCATDEDKRSALSAIINAVNDDLLVNVLKQHGEAVRRCFDKGDVALGKRLQQALSNLPNSPQQFSNRLDVLQQWADYFPDPQKRLDACRSLRGSFQELRHAAALPKPGLLQRITSRPTDTFDKEARIGETMAMAVIIVMPKDSANTEGATPQDFLLQLGRTILGRDRLFEDRDIWGKVSRCIETGAWPEDVYGYRTASRPGGNIQSDSLRSSQRLAFMMVGGAVVLSAGMYFLFKPGARQSIEQKNTAGQTARAPANALPSPDTPAAPPAMAMNSASTSPFALSTGSNSGTTAPPKLPAAPPPPKATTPAAMSEDRRVGLETEYRQLEARFLDKTKVYLDPPSDGKVLDQIDRDRKKILDLALNPAQERIDPDLARQHRAAELRLMDLARKQKTFNDIRERAKKLLESLDVLVSESFPTRLDELCATTAHATDLHSAAAQLQKDYTATRTQTLAVSKLADTKITQCDGLVKDLKTHIASLISQYRVRYHKLPELNVGADPAFAYFGNPQLAYSFSLHSAKSLKCVPTSDTQSPNKVDILADLSPDQKPNREKTSLSLATFAMADDGALTFRWNPDANLSTAAGFISELRSAVLEVSSGDNQFFIAMYKPFEDPTPAKIEFSRDPSATQRILGKASFTAPALGTQITSTSYYIRSVTCHGETAFLLSDSNLTKAIPGLKGHTATLSRPEWVDVPESSRRWTITLKIDALSREALLEKAKISKEFYNGWQRKKKDLEKLNTLAAAISKNALEAEFNNKKEIGKPMRDQIDQLIELITAGESPDSMISKKCRNIPRPPADVKPDKMTQLEWQGHNSNYAKAVVKDILPLGVTLRTNKEREINEVNGNLSQEEFAYTDDLLKSLGGISSVSIVLYRGIDVPDVQLEDIVVGKPTVTVRGNK